MTGPSSSEIASRFDLRIPPDLAAWWDQGLWEGQTGGEFCRGQSPADMLAPPPGTIWAGLMLPDALPLIGNELGDWLCLRVGASDGVSEYIGWYHGGGDWTPLGDTLQESLCCDALLQAAHWLAAPVGTIPEAPASAAGADTALTLDRLAEVLAAHGMPPSGAPQRAEFAPEAAAAALQHWAQRTLHGAPAVVHRCLALQALASPLHQLLDSQFARQHGLSWEPEIVRGLFDHRLLSAPVARAARERVGLPAAATGSLAEEPAAEEPAGKWRQLLNRQDWATAEKHALSVIRCRGDLGWAWDVAGWSAERRGDRETAIARYACGVRTSSFTDATLAFRSHWFPPEFGKFAAARLWELRDALPDQLRRDPYLACFWGGDEAALRADVQQYWLQAAATHLDSGRPQQAYHCYYQAGWDLGATGLEPYREILDGLIAAATAAGQLGRARVAQLHRSQLGG